MRRLIFAALAFSNCLALADAHAAIGDIYYVNRTNTATPQDGLSWATAFATIQQGIEKARQTFGGEVWVTRGLYDEARTGGTVQLRATVDVYGGFLGTETERTQRNATANVTIIDGSIANAGGPSTAGVVTGADNSTLDGFTIRGGRGDNGGGMINNATSPVISNCIFTGNEVTGFGGAMINIGASNPIIQHCTFNDNHAAQSGGGVANTGASPLLEDCVFTANIAEVAGGAVFNTPGSGVSVKRCTFSQNESITGGGAIFNEQANASLEESRFSGNSTQGFGGAIFNNIAEPLIVNSVFDHNHADQRGGAVANQNSNATIINCTIADNDATLKGDGIFDNASDPKIVNCILWANTPYEFDDVGGSNSDVSYSDVEGRENGVGNLNVDPGFKNEAAGDYSLNADSFCINAGTTDDAPATDILGLTRPQGAGVDMGAYEATDIGSPPPVVVKALTCSGAPELGRVSSARGDVAVLILCAGMLAVWSRKRVKA